MSKKSKISSDIITILSTGDIYEEGGFSLTHISDDGTIMKIFRMELKLWETHFFVPIREIIWNHQIIHPCLVKADITIDIDEYSDSDDDYYDGKADALFEDILDRKFIYMLNMTKYNTGPVYDITGKDFDSICSRLLFFIRYLYQNYGIMHADLFPRNFVWTGENKMLIIDLGLVKHIHDPHDIPTAVKYEYRCPEWDEDMLKYSLEDELWSTGAVIIELLHDKLWDKDTYEDFAIIRKLVLECIPADGGPLDDRIDILISGGLSTRSKAILGRMMAVKEHRWSADKIIRTFGLELSDTDSEERPPLDLFRHPELPKKLASMEEAFDLDLKLRLMPIMDDLYETEEGKKTIMKCIDGKKYDKLALIDKITYILKVSVFYIDRGKIKYDIKPVDLNLTVMVLLNLEWDIDQSFRLMHP